MPRPIRAVPPAAPVPVAALHRRRQQVVVRAPGSTAPLPEALLDGQDRRDTQPTLPGLGFRDHADTLPNLDLAPLPDDEATPVSLIRVKTAPRSTMLPPPPSAAERPRPVTLLDDVHDDASRNYLAEARAILESGVFDESDESA